jgi:hypothetical protein
MASYVECTALIELLIEVIKAGSVKKVAFRYTYMNYDCQDAEKKHVGNGRTTVQFVLSVLLSICTYTI